MNREILPGGKRPEIGLIANELSRIRWSERLVKNFHYGIDDLEQEMVRAVDIAPRYIEYPEKGLTMTEQEYDLWVCYGRRVERFVGTPSHRPPFFIERHSNRYDAFGSRRSPIVAQYDGVKLLPHPIVEGVNWASDGSPLHPFLKLLLTQTNKGLPTGPGFFWNLGPLKTADSVFLRVFDHKLQVLLVNRSDGGGWALPGGFVERTKRTTPGVMTIGTIESNLDAAKRESKEETGIMAFDDIPSVCILQNIPVADRRMTAQAWPVTSVHVFFPNYETGLRMIPQKDRDETLDVGWFNVSGDSTWAGATSDSLYASHVSYLKLALLAWERQTGLIIRNDSVIGKPDFFEEVFLNTVAKVRSIFTKYS